MAIIIRLLSRIAEWRGAKPRVFAVEEKCSERRREVFVRSNFGYLPTVAPGVGLVAVFGEVVLAGPRGRDF